MGAPAAQNQLAELIKRILKPLAALRENLALRRAAPPLGGINITPYVSHPISRSSHLYNISNQELVEPER